LKPVEALWRIYKAGKGTNQVMAYYTCNVYNSNTPFENEQWIVGGIVNDQVLYKESLEIKKALAFAICLSVFFGVMVAIIMIRNMMSPIRVLLNGLKARPQGVRKLPRTDIWEFDELATAIEYQSEEIYKEGSRVSDIIQMTDMQLGVVEIRHDADRVFCTEQVLHIFDLENPNWKDNYIDKTIYEEELARIRTLVYQVPEEKMVYRYPLAENQFRYVQIKKKLGEDRELYIVMDVTDDMLEKQNIRHQRDYDGLTHLYNRWAFNREAENIIEDENIKTGVFSMWNLDSLKFINDTYGHDTGDKYIAAMATVLKNVEDDNCIVARRSGDEFMMFCYNDTVERLIKKTESVHEQALKTRIELPDGNEIAISVSTGMAMYPKDAADLQNLMLYSDFAMYEVKQNSRGDIKRFELASYTQNSMKLLGIGEFTRILEENSIRYAFQPIVDIKNKKVFGYEALMRPQSKLFKSPLDLLSVAESQSKLGQVEKVTWFNAIRDFLKFIPENDDARVFINSIPNQCLRSEEFQQLEEMLGDNISRVVMEVTENVKADENMLRTKQSWCEKNNIAMALDDFGTGYSNADILVEKKFSFVKLDMGIVKQLPDRKDTRDIVRSIVDYCHSNNQRVIAEGVETERELEVVASMDIDYVQGYYFSKPVFDISDVVIDFER
jgi:diguanylate cyclase (GGDEF)-like protein